ncbi:MAG: hypothetical protein ACLUIX_09500 [Oscillospiraceae bacterium]
MKKGVTGVTLVLSGLTLTADGTAAIACNKSSGVTIVARTAPPISSATPGPTTTTATPITPTPKTPSSSARTALR